MTAVTILLKPKLFLIFFKFTKFSPGASLSWRLYKKLSGWTTPLFGIRMAGPLGKKMITKFRKDLTRLFLHIHENNEVVLQYIYHSNGFHSLSIRNFSILISLKAQTASGEQAFSKLSVPVAWAKSPLIERLPEQLSPDTSVIFLFGQNTWVDIESGFELFQQIKLKSKADVQFGIISKVN